MRLACVKHAASVRSEPGSNSQVHQTQAAPRQDNPGTTNRPETHQINPSQYKQGQKTPSTSTQINPERYVTHQRYTTHHAKSPKAVIQQAPKPAKQQHPKQHSAPAAYPFLITDSIVKELRPNLRRLPTGVGGGGLLSACHAPVNTDLIELIGESRQLFSSDAAQAVLCRSSSFRVASVDQQSGVSGSDMHGRPVLDRAFEDQTR